jgi:HK97 gp10 family phage protein
MGVSVIRPKKLNARRLSANVRQAVSDAVGLTAYEIEIRAKILAPVDTGFLRGSIQADVKSGSLTATVSVGVDYGRYVEEGTRFQNAQPYFEPAIEDSIPNFERHLEKAVQKGVRQG